MVPVCNRSRYSDSLRAGRSGDQIPVEVRFSAPVQTGPRAHLAPYTMGTGSFLGVKGPGHSINHSPHLAPRLKSRAIHLLPLWAFVACFRVNFTFTFTFTHMEQHKDLNSYFPRQNCRVPMMLPAGQAASSALYTTRCKHSLVFLRMGKIIT